MVCGCMSSVGILAAKWLLSGAARCRALLLRLSPGLPFRTVGCEANDARPRAPASSLHRPDAAGGLKAVAQRHLGEESAMRRGKGRGLRRICQCAVAADGGAPQEC